MGSGELKRKAISTRTRFEIFKRDGFRCTYCGVSPLQKALRVDHVVPVSDGGDSSPSNLATSCFDCNAGKAAVRLEHKKYATPKATDADRDHAEQIREFLALQREAEEAKRAVVEELAIYWEERIGKLSQEMYERLGWLIANERYETLIDAINITGARMPSPFKVFDHRVALKQVKYFHGILRRKREQAEQGEVA